MEIPEVCELVTRLREEDVPYANHLFKAAADTIEALVENLREVGPVREWAQSYVNAGRWAGHDSLDAVKTELLERDSLVRRLECDLRLLRRGRIRTLIAGPEGSSGRLRRFRWRVWKSVKDLFGGP